MFAAKLGISALCGKYGIGSRRSDLARGRAPARHATRTRDGAVDELARAIGAFMMTGGRQVQIDPGVAHRTAAAVAGGLHLVNLDDFVGRNHVLSVVSCRAGAGWPPAEGDDTRCHGTINDPRS